MQRFQRTHAAAAPHAWEEPSTVLHPRPRGARQLLLRVYNWCLWVIVFFLLCSQVFGVLSTTRESEQQFIFGRDPQHGPTTFPGSNDDPFTDRVIVCSLKGRLFQPVLLSEVLASPVAVHESSNVAASAVDGYRVIDRDNISLDPHTRRRYNHVCSQLATTLDEIVSACFSLGYKISDTMRLRIVTSDDTLVTISSVLPVLVMPFWDNAELARFVAPSEDGSACIFRLAGKFDNPRSTNSFLRGVNRSVRHRKTEEWLGVEGGVWRHGWYEHEPSRSRWYSDVISSDKSSSYGIIHRQFDLVTRTESDCINTDECAELELSQFWGKDLVAVNHIKWYTSVVIMDGTRKGLFMYRSLIEFRVLGVYRIETLLSNVSMAFLLIRWLIGLIATHSIGQTTGIGVLSCARSFHVMPILLLPRMKTILTAFFTIGCFFEGDQRSLSEGYFAMYPAIAEFVVLFYGVLNLFAKMLRRRVSDVLFGPTLITFCVLHFVRSNIAQSQWFGIDGRVTTMVTSSEYEAAKLIHFLTTDIGYRLNGGAWSLYSMKLGFMALQVVALLVLSDSTSQRRQRPISAAEKALAVRVGYSGGLGRSTFHDTYISESPRYPQPIDLTASGVADLRQFSSHKAAVIHVITPYEVIRAGFVVLGPNALVSTRDWFLFMASAPFRRLRIPMNHIRMTAYTITKSRQISRKDVYEVSERPQLLRVTDPRFAGVDAWDVSLWSLQ